MQVDLILLFALFFFKFQNFINNIFRYGVDENLNNPP